MKLGTNNTGPNRVNFDQTERVKLLADSSALFLFKGNHLLVKIKKGNFSYQQTLIALEIVTLVQLGISALRIDERIPNSF